eukprot:TRINITY_DN12306_c0_g2_i1.p1 TRINITY_DN12306_c0_g2~~TRINITY_DN12306_c0_g2_i1.p1  ORF type:complete len:223 (+),score=44.76 TRINITY_DN12306_c0_g2_i1:20-688(+)
MACGLITALLACVGFWSFFPGHSSLLPHAQTGFLLLQDAKVRFSCGAWNRRSALCAALLLHSPPAFAEADPPTSTPGVVILRLAEVSAVQEDTLRKSVSGDEYVIGRGMFTASVRVMLRKSELAAKFAEAVLELPAQDRERGQAFARTCLQKFQQIAEVDSKGQGDLTKAELTQMADLYASAREEMRLFFQLLPEAVQQRSKAQARAVKEYERRQLERGGAE